MRNTETESCSPGGQEQTGTQTETRGPQERGTSEKQETRATVPWGPRCSRGRDWGRGSVLTGEASPLARPGRALLSPEKSSSGASPGAAAAARHRRI